MIDALKTLFENDVVSEEIRAQIEEAWESKVIDDKEFVEDKNFYKLFNPPYALYKKNWWTKKEFR